MTDEPETRRVVYPDGEAPIVTVRHFVRDGRPITHWTSTTGHTVKAEDQGKTISAQVHRPDRQPLDYAITEGVQPSDDYAQPIDHDLRTLYVWGVLAGLAVLAIPAALLGWLLLPWWLAGALWAAAGVWWARWVLETWRFWGWVRRHWG